MDVLSVLVLRMVRMGDDRMGLRLVLFCKISAKKVKSMKLQFIFIVLYRLDILIICQVLDTACSVD